MIEGRQSLLHTSALYPLVTGDGHQDVVYLDFSKALDTVRHSILLEKLAAHSLNGCTLCWIKNWLKS